MPSQQNYRKFQKIRKTLTCNTLLLPGNHCLPYRQRRNFIKCRHRRHNQIWKFHDPYNCGSSQRQSQTVKVHTLETCDHHVVATALNEARAPMLPSFAIFQIRRHLHIDYEIHDPLVRVVLIVSDFGSSVTAVASELSTKQQFFFFQSF